MDSVHQIIPSSNIHTANTQERRLLEKKKRIKRCHGNRKLRRFRKKWRKRGKTDGEIQQLIAEYPYRNQSERNNQRLSPMTTTDDNSDITSNTSTKSKKRKRITTSVSQRSIQELVPKKKKKKTKKTNNNVLSSNNIVSRSVGTTTTVYKMPKYLKILQNLLFQTLRIQLKHTLKKKKEQKYIHDRLRLLDQQYRLELHRNLWQTYLVLGSEQQLWPNQVIKMAKTTEHELCQQFVRNHLSKLNQQYDKCTTQLSTQSLSCPATLLSLQTLDQQLKEFVQFQEKYIRNRMDVQLTRYKNTIHEKELLSNLCTSNLTIDQTTIFNQIQEQQQKQVEVFEKLLQLETRISMEYLPSHFRYVETFIDSDLYSQLSNKYRTREFKRQRCKIIQETKRAWLNIYLQTYESQIHECEQKYHQKLVQLKENLTLDNSFIAYMNYRQKRLVQEIYDEKLPIYRRKLLRLYRQQFKMNKKLVGVLPKILLDISYNPFTTRELAYLSRGSTYIRPNQSILRPYEQRMKNIKGEHDNIMNKLQNYMANLRHRPQLSRTSPLYKNYSDRLQIYLTSQYMASLSFIDLVRARRELRLVRSIRYKLNKYKLILRRTDKSGILHIGQAQDYQQKAVEYRQKTHAYEELPTNPLNETFLKVIQLLNKLQTTNKIKVYQQDRMKPIREKTELAYMYFIPKAHKIGIPLRPIINTIHASTTGISKFLDQLIRPLFDMYARSTTIIDGVDLLRKLHAYTEKGYLKSSTLFITFDITDLYTMLPQEESLKILAEFLHEHHCEKINGISIDTIIELARIVLQENVFVYKNKFYRQIIGGAMGSAFTLTLANIFMWKWQQETILCKLPSHEYYGRYIDDIFFTWNESEDKVKRILDAANRFHPNIKLTYTIEKTLPFLDLLLSNQNGRLVSSVYHKPAAEPTLLSFLSDHPRHVFRNVIQTGLIRAVRYSSTLEAFNIEQRHIHLKLIYNGYPSRYIHAQFHRFFSEHLSSSSSTEELLSLIDNEQQFLAIRQKLLTQPTHKQAEVEKRIAEVSIINHELTIISTAGKTNTASSMNMATVKPNDNKFDNTLFIHCKHEARLEGLKRHIHEIHDSIFKNTDFGDIRLIVGHRNNPDIDFELCRKRPPTYILKDQPKNKKIKVSETVTTE